MTPDAILFGLTLFLVAEVLRDKEFPPWAKPIIVLLLVVGLLGIAVALTVR